MRNYLSIDSAPYDEKCAQIGSPDFLERNRAECRRFIRELRAVLGEEPEGAHLAVKAFHDHDFGTYYEVVCYYYDEIPESGDYAFDCEGADIPRWTKGTEEEV